MQQIQQQFVSQPHAAPAGGKKKAAYRDENEADYLNLMNDPRVIRGTNFTANLSGTGGKSNTKTNNSNNLMSKTMANPPTTKLAGTKRPGKKSITNTTLNSADYLEELIDRPIEMDVDTQQGAVSDRPQSPLFVQAKISRDVDTQINQGDLFDFDLEVVPILELLVGRTLNVALLEVKQEDEIESIYKKQRDFEQIRNIELAEVQRLEAEQNRKLQEQVRRMAQEEKRKLDKEAQLAKISAKMLAHECVTDLSGTVMSELDKKGHFKDPLFKEIKEEYLNNVAAGVHRNCNKRMNAAALADELLLDALSRAEDISRKAGFTDEP